MSSILLAGLTSYENCLSQNCKKADEEKKKLLAEKYVRSKATEQQAMMSTQEKSGVSLW